MDLHRVGAHIEQLELSPMKSHVGRMLKTQNRIFRQGFEFLEAINNYPYFRVGLNFVGFQGSTEKIFRIINTVSTN